MKDYNVQSVSIHFKSSYIKLGEVLLAYLPDVYYEIFRVDEKDVGRKG